MKISHRRVKVRDVVAGYNDNEDDGVVAYGGELDVRPPYQRAFVYDQKQRAAVVGTVLRGFPLNVMYWVAHEDGGFEVLDGQQRTISIAQYVQSKYSVNDLFFDNLPQDKKEAILNYELMVYVCEGTDSEKLDWFRVINMAGEVLTAQELRNAVYHGTWLSDAKVKFSRTGCAAYEIGDSYVSGVPIRQILLEKALGWAAGRDGVTIEGYMASHQRDLNANELWFYYSAVIGWAAALFPTKRKELRNVPWGPLYDMHHAAAFDATLLETEVARLMQDEDVSKKSGIYAYVLDGNEKHLSIRAFNEKQKREAYERQSGVCPVCLKKYEIQEMEADHIKPWSKGGRTSPENCQMLCADDNRRKSNT